MWAADEAVVECLHVATEAGTAGRCTAAGMCGSRGQGSCNMRHTQHGTDAGHGHCHTRHCAQGQTPLRGAGCSRSTPLRGAAGACTATSSLAGWPDTVAQGVHSSTDLPAVALPAWIPAPVPLSAPACRHSFTPSLPSSFSSRCTTWGGGGAG